MFENMLIFWRGLLTFKYEIPIPMQIGAYLTVAVIITAVIIIFRSQLDLSPTLRDRYMWYYFVAIFNLINICAVLGYYYYKKNRIIGQPGPAGQAGPRGDPGGSRNCSLCDESIYILTKNEYDTMATLDYVELADRVISPELSPALGELERILTRSGASFDYGEFTNNLVNGSFDPENELTRRMVLLSIYNEYPLIRNINQNMGLSDAEATGIISSLAGSLGYFRLSDMAFGGSKPYDPTGFLVNGDIRIPDELVQVCTFTTIQESGNTAKFAVMSLKPPEGYVALGVAVQPVIDGSPKADPTGYAVVRKSCTKKLDRAQLKLVFIYPGSSYNSNETEGYFSIWRTPFSTIHVKYSDGNFQMNKTILENLYLSAPGGDPAESIYTKSGTVKKNVVGEVEAYFNRIRLPKVVFASVLFGHVVEASKENLRQFVAKYVPGQIMQTEALSKCRTPGSMRAVDISRAMRDIREAMDENIEKKSAEAERQMGAKSRIRSITDIDDPIEARKQNIDYQMLMDYEKIKNLVMSLSVKIENGKTFMDLIRAIFPGGLNTRLMPDTLLETQSRMLNIMCTLVPPETDVYILNNTCLAYDHIDEKRQEVGLELEKSMARVNLLTRDLNKDGTCSEKNIAEINKEVEATYEFIGRNLGHIPNYLDKLQRGNFKEFTTDKIITVTGQVTRLAKFIEGRCQPTGSKKSA